MSRVTEIRYVGYGVKDFDAEKAYYTDVWGLEPVAEDAGHAWFKAQGHDEHHVVSASKGALTVGCPRERRARGV